MKGRKGNKLKDSIITKIHRADFSIIFFLPFFDFFSYNINFVLTTRKKKKAAQITNAITLPIDENGLAYFVTKQLFSIVWDPFVFRYHSVINDELKPHSQ